MARSVCPKLFRKHLGVAAQIFIINFIYFRQQNGRYPATEHERHPRHHIQRHLPPALRFRDDSLRSAMTVGLSNG
jgi:hypothetical protein